MKRSISMNTKITTIIIAVCIVAVNWACDKEPENSPTPAEVSLSILKSKTWTVTSVALDGIDHTQVFSGLTVSFADNSISASNGHFIWPIQDTWHFTNSDATAFLRGDGIEVSILTLSKTSLEVRLTWPDQLFGPGRSLAVSGEYVFRFE